MTTPDTLITPYNDAVAGSRTTYHMGNAILMAARDVRRKILELAGEVLKTEPSRLTLFEGRIIEQGVGERITLKALLTQKFGPTGMEILGEAHFKPGRFTAACSLSRA